MECKTCREALSALLDGELAEQEEPAIRKHLEYCPECSAEHDSLVRFSALTDRLPSFSPSDGLWQRIEAEMSRPRMSILDSFLSPLLRRWVPVSVMGVIIAIALVVNFWPLQPPAQQEFVGFLAKRERVFEEQRRILFERELLDRYRQIRNPFSQPVTFVDYNPFEE